MRRLLLASSLVLLTFSLTGYGEDSQAGPSRAEQVQDWTIRARDPRPVPEQSKKFGGNRVFGSTSTARVRPFPFMRGFQTKKAYTKDYSGSKSFWTGEYRGSKPTNLATKYEMQGKGKKFGTKPVETKTAYGSDKLYASSAYETHSATIRGTAQGAIDADVPNRQNLSIEQVRELLNKNK